MPSDTNGIREVDVKLPENGDGRIEVIFGPHHRIRIEEEGEEVNFELVATHHGFKASANDDLPTRLESIITHVRKEFPELAID